jgi:hypothetical protein
MQPTVINAVSAESVSYEEAPLAELEVDGVAYRVDPGRGSSVAVSRRESGSWDWTPVTEGRWDGSRLRAKGLEHPIVTALADALGVAMRERAKDGAA